MTHYWNYLLFSGDVKSVMALIQAPGSNFLTADCSTTLLD
ncbi:hypothetical protein SynTAK9802_01859 [Synechococcus sp. TAK9802]|nr:hypothetical protein SynTAK9802_01859 [Synechococcus sp. TAK9802]